MNKNSLGPLWWNQIITSAPVVFMLANVFVKYDKPRTILNYPFTTLQSSNVTGREIPPYQWDFQDPKLEVPTIYKAYVRPM